ncbi:hypothetical protein U8V72_14520 [Priestia filamentosa]|uniref:hypothetical protein n=1 Tax=Priestia filamentosa TaxID=1402861 RepID=UPI00397E8AA5
MRKKVLGLLTLGMAACASSLLIDSNIYIQSFEVIVGATLNVTALILALTHLRHEDKDMNAHIEA